MNLNLTHVSATASLFEATFSEDLELKSCDYNGRRIRLTPWRRNIIAGVFENENNLEEILAEAIYERRNHNYSDC